MNTSEVIDMFRSGIANTRKSGATQVSLDDLAKYADFLQETAGKTPEGAAAGEVAMEEYKADLAIRIDSVQQRHETRIEMMRATIATAQLALKSSLLINGGASVALLAFVGGIWNKEDDIETIRSISEALFIYVFGVLSAALAAGFTYLAQAGYGEEFGKYSMKIGRTGHVAAVLLLVFSYCLFAKASWLAFLGVGKI